jgi:carbon starvation protein
LRAGVYGGLSPVRPVSGPAYFFICSEAPTPAHRRQDGIDYVPTGREILFGHHFTSIAGTGPIVGPAIGVIWVKN